MEKIIEQVPTRAMKYGKTRYVDIFRDKKGVIYAYTIDDKGEKADKIPLYCVSKSLVKYFCDAYDRIRLFEKQEVEIRNTKRSKKKVSDHLEG